MAYNRRSSRKGVYRKPWPIRSRKRWIGTVAVAGVTVTPTTGTLVLTGYAPSVLTPRLVTPTTGTLVLTGYAPSVLTPRLVTPGTGTLVLTGYAPTVLAPRLVTPSTGALILTGFAPAVLTPRLVTPSTGALILTGYAPTVTAAAHVSVTPATGSLVLTGHAPTVTATGAVSDTPVLRGVPSLPTRRRPQVTEVSGAGLVRVVGIGKLTGDAALAGELLQPNEGEGSLVVDGVRLLVGVIHAGAEAVLAGTRAMTESPAIYCDGGGRLVGEFATAGIMAVAAEIAGRAWGDTPIGGRMPIRSGGEGVAVLEENDEQVGLWLLGLPSEIEA